MVLVLSHQTRPVQDVRIRFMKVTAAALTRSLSLCVYSQKCKSVETTAQQPQQQQDPPLPTKTSAASPLAGIPALALLVCSALHLITCEYRRRLRSPVPTQHHNLSHMALNQNQHRPQESQRAQTAAPERIIPATAAPGLNPNTVVVVVLRSSVRRTVVSAASTVVQDGGGAWTDFMTAVQTSCLHNKQTNKTNRSPWRR